MVNNISEAKRRVVTMNILKGLVFASLLGLLFFHNLKRPRIMILQSYDPTFMFVRDFETGIKKALKNEIEPLVETYYMNMIGKTSSNQKVEEGQEAIRAIDHFKPKILISVGDEAQEFAAKHYLNHKKTKIIFAGLLGDYKKYGYRPGENVGGIIAEQPIDELNTFINYMLNHKKNIRLSHLGDRSAITNLFEQILKKHPWKNIKLIDSLKFADFESFKIAAQDLNKRSDVILVSSYCALSQEKDKSKMVSKEIMQWLVDNTTVPIISTSGRAVEEGAGAALVTSAYQQGILAMDAALMAIKDKTYLPNISTKIFNVLINEHHLEKFHLKIPNIYQSFAENSEKLYHDSKKK